MNQIEKLIQVKNKPRKKKITILTQLFAWSSSPASEMKLKKILGFFSFCQDVPAFWDTWGQLRIYGHFVLSSATHF